MIFKYRQGDSLFHRLDPLSKFVWLACVSILSLYYRDVLDQLILLGVIILIAVLMAKLSWQMLWRGMRIPFWLGLPYFVIQLFFIPGETEVAQLGPFILTEEALNYAGAISLRLLILVLGSMLYIITTDPRDLVFALAQKGRVPYRFAYAISIALRFVPIMEAEGRIIQDAQRLRGFGIPKSWRQRLAWQRRFIMAVFISAVRRVEQIATVMDLKGFGQHSIRTYRKMITISNTGKLLSIVSIILTCVSIFLRT